LAKRSIKYELCVEMNLILNGKEEDMKGNLRKVREKFCKIFQKSQPTPPPPPPKKNEKFFT